MCGEGGGVQIQGTMLEYMYEQCIVMGTAERWSMCYIVVGEYTDTGCYNGVVKVEGFGWGEGGGIVKEKTWVQMLQYPLSPVG